MTFRVTAPPSGYPGDSDVLRFFHAAGGALLEVPGVEAAGFVSRLPLSSGESASTVIPEGWDSGDGQAVWSRLTTPGYFEALGFRLVMGRFPAGEHPGGDQTVLAVINRAAADAFWPGQSPIGKHFYGPGHSGFATVAAVVEDVREKGQTQPVQPTLYAPASLGPRRTMYAVVRTREPPTAMLAELKRAIWSVSPGVPISRVETLEQVAERGLKPMRTLTILAAIAGAVTLLLGVLGVYGVMSHAVARRTRELGVRAALGAGKGRLLGGELAGSCARAWAPDFSWRWLRDGRCAARSSAWMPSTPCRSAARSCF